MASLRRSLRLSSTNVVVTPAPDKATSRKRKTVAKVAAAEAAPKNKGKAVSKTVPDKRRTSVTTTEAAAVAVSGDGGDDMTPTPATPPPKKRRVGRTETPPPITPLGLGREAPRHAAIRRLANPEATNAQLLSPETSRVVSAASLDFEAPSPTKAKSTATTTTDNLLQVACQHLIQVDARMEPLIASRECKLFTPEGLAEQIDPFESLASSIISQQVSGAAAKAIKERFLQLFVAEGDAEKKLSPETAAPAPLCFPHPSQVAKMPLPQLRSAGLSQRKAEYVQGLAGHFVSGQLSAQLLADAPYETLMERLLEVRGLGRWSVEMFALFGLKRMDVFSVGDLGVQRGMAAFIGRDVAKLKKKAAPGAGEGKAANKKWRYMTDTEMEAMAEPFRPYRSLFMWYMWQVEATDVSTMEV